MPMRRNTTPIQFGVTLDPKLCKEIDKLRQDIPRSHVIERALIHYIADLKKGKISLLQGAQLPTQRQAEQLVRFNNSNNTPTGDEDAKPATQEEVLEAVSE